MYKATIEVLKLTNMKVKLAALIDADKASEQKFGKIISKFSMDGNNYLKIASRAYITLDVTDNKIKKESGWNANNSVNLNPLNLYKFCYHFRKFIATYTNTKSLYYYDQTGNLILNNADAEKVEDCFDVGGKRIYLRPIVVQNFEGQRGVQSEGCLLAINTFDSSAEITFEEMECLYACLMTTDITSSSLQLISLAESYRDAEAVQLGVKTVSEITIEPVDDGQIYVKQKPVSEIPDI